MPLIESVYRDRERRECVEKQRVFVCIEIER